jgi:hypothetical protein
MEWTPKDPDETRRYVIDWREIYPDTIASFTLTRTAGTVEIEETDNDSRAVYALLSGGVDAETATFLHRITTDEGQVLERTISLRIGAGADSLSPASTITKGALGARALHHLGIANYVFDVESEETISTLKTLDSMIAEWQAKLNDMGYIQPATNGTSQPSDPAGIDEAMVEAVAANLALRVAPSYGKTTSGELRAMARDGRSFVFSSYSRARAVEIPSYLPLGAGNRRQIRIFHRRADAEL